MHVYQTEGVGDLYFWKISPVFWKPVTLWQSHWYVKSDPGSDMWNSFSKVSRVPAELWKSIQCSSALQNYCMLPFTAYIAYEATCVSKVIHLKWNITIGLASAKPNKTLGNILSWIVTVYTHTYTHTHQRVYTTTHCYTTQHPLNISVLPKTCRKLCPLTCDIAHSHVLKSA